MTNLNDPAIVAAAIAGFEKQLATIEGYLSELRSLQSGSPAKASVKVVMAAAAPAPAVAAAPAAPAAGPKKRRVMSAASRKAIAAAQKKRWAEYHKKNGK